MLKTFKEHVEKVETDEMTTVGHVGGGMVGEPLDHERRKRSEKSLLVTVFLRFLLKCLQSARAKSQNMLGI